MSIENLFAVLIGGLITWFASWIYYKKAGDELRAEMDLMKKANRVIAYMLENPNAQIEVKRDAKGNPVAMIVSTTAHLLDNATTDAKK